MLPARGAQRGGGGWARGAGARAGAAPGGGPGAARAEAQCKKAELLNKVWTKKVLPLVWTRCGAWGLTFTGPRRVD